MNKERNSPPPQWKKFNIQKNPAELFSRASLDVQGKKQIDILKNIFLNILEVIDDIERIQKSEKRQKYLNVIKRKLLKLLEKNGVSPMCFDDNKAKLEWCEVFSFEKRNNVKDNTIIEEIKKGYLWNSKVLRMAGVIVVKNEE